MSTLKRIKTRILDHRVRHVWQQVTGHQCAFQYQEGGSLYAFDASKYDNETEFANDLNEVIHRLEDPVGASVKRVKLGIQAIQHQITSSINALAEMKGTELELNEFIKKWHLKVLDRQMQRQFRNLSGDRCRYVFGLGHWTHSFDAKEAHNEADLIDVLKAFQKNLTAQKTPVEFNDSYRAKTA